MGEYRLTAGLEVHAELLTKTKIFCGCLNRFADEANMNVCPVCLGLPGSLPVLNEKVLEYAVRAALALNCEIPGLCGFDRKNYFYPDLPKGYQISQDYLPVAKNGSIEFASGGGKSSVRINNIHIEEDAGKNLHAGDTGLSGESLVDFNRSGVPLLEIVTEPDMHSRTDVEAFMTSLRDILLYTAVSDCRMEEGSLRFEANISIAPDGKKLGRRVEIKNLNSFKIVLKALDYEIERQSGMLDEGVEILPETRLFDEKSGRTFPMRGKEEAHDYRYFPEPDLPSVEVSREYVENVRSAMPELPRKKYERFLREYSIPAYDAEVLVSSPALACYFEKTASLFPEPKTVSNWVMGEVLGILKEKGGEVSDCRVSPENLAGLLGLLKGQKINSAQAKTVLRGMFDSGRDAETIVREEGLLQLSDAEQLRGLVSEVLAGNRKAVGEYRSGRGKALGFLVGQVMRRTSGRANPAVVNKILKEELEK
jgi:aspartyl-tRNA(Asn)/glutamyl-tRNA(Gln) amidotransferase subunit B